MCQSLTAQDPDTLIISHCHQFLVCSPLNHSTLRDNRHPVDPADRAEAMCDHNGCAALLFLQIIKSFLDLMISKPESATQRNATQCNIIRFGI